jgi:hypothetical protein
VRCACLPSGAKDGFPVLQWAACDGAADLTRSWLAWRTFDVVAKNNRFRDFFHRFAALPALPLQRDVGFWLAQLQIPLEDSFGAFDDLPGLQLFGKLGILSLEPRHFNFRPYQKSDRGNQVDLALTVVVRLSVLQVYDSDQLVSDSTGTDRNCLVTASDHEVREQRIQLKGWTELLKNCIVLVERCGVANARTLHCHSCRLFLTSPIERIHRHDSSP